MKIRLMTADDYDEVRALWKSCPGVGLNELDDSPKGISAFLARNPETCFVAEEEKIAGVILAGNDGRRGYIYHTAVSPGYRRRHIGESLVGAVVDALKKLGIHKTALVVFAENETGNAFWEKMGFTVRKDLVYCNRALTDLRSCIS